jgi:hypothetical protein
MNSCNIINKEFFRETILQLNFAQEELRKDLIYIKSKLIDLNFREFGDKFIHTYIFELSELKEQLKCYKSLNMKKGKVKENGKIITYSTIISKETADKKINIIEKEITVIQNHISQYNNATIYDLDVTKITFDIASKIIN